MPLHTTTNQPGDQRPAREHRPGRRRAALQLGAAGLLILLLVYLVDNVAEDQLAEPPSGAQGLDADYDYFLAGAEATRFDVTGRPLYRFRSERYTHFPSPDHALMDAPRFIIFREEETPWRVSARTGRVETDVDRAEEKVDLHDDVEIHRPDATGREINVYTDYLSVYPDSQFASTDRRVRLETDGTRITSTGMTADLTTNRIQLLSNVQGIHEPPAEQ